MSVDRRVRELVEEIIESDTTPERVCAGEPELLPAVLKRLDRLKRMDVVIEKLFPCESTLVGRPTDGVEHKLPRIEGYEVQTCIGRGGMGVVFRAVHLATGRTVALKMLRFGSCAGTVEWERFILEYKVLAQLNHPRIVQVYEVGATDADDQPYFTMEFVPGGTLEERILEQGPQNSIYAATIVEKLASAISAAHQKGIIHRDLKPLNVLLTAEQEPKVTDFGLARFVEDAPALTMTGVGIGTPSYMAKEQAAGRRDLGEAVDIHALGAILYALLTGRPPFRGETNADTIQQVLTAEPVPPSRLNPKVHRDLETICLKCLEKDAGKRYESAALLGDRLRMFLSGRPIPDRPVGNLERGWRWCRRNPQLASAITLSTSLVIALAILAGIFGITKSRDNDRLSSALNKSQRQEILSAWDYGRQLCESGEIGHGVLVIAKALESVPAEETALRQSLEMELAAWHSQCHTLQNVFRHPDKVLTMAASSDGKWFVTGCVDGVIRRWDLDSGVSRELGRHQGVVRKLAISADGQTIVAGGDKGQLIQWNAANGEQVRQVTGHAGGIRAIAVSPDGRLALTGGMDSEARLWDLPRLTVRTTLEHDAPVLAVAFSPDETTFFTGSGSDDSGELRLYEIGCDMPILQESMDGRVLSGAFSRDGELLVVGDGDWETSFWAVESRRQIATTDFTNGMVTGIAFSPADEATMLLGSHETCIAMFWDAVQLREQWEEQVRTHRLGLSERQRLSPEKPSIPHPQPLTAVAFLPPAADSFLTASEDGYVRLWKKARGLQKKTIVHDPEKRRVDLRLTGITPAGDVAATGGDDGRIVLWDVASGRPIGDPLDCLAPVIGIAFAMDGGTLVSATKDGHLRVWDVPTRKLIEKPEDVTDGISGISISKDRQSILVGSGGYAQRWTIRPLRKAGDPLIHKANAPDCSVMTAISSNDDRYLTVGQDGIAKLWRRDGSLIAELLHQNEIRSGAFSPDDAWVITASDDKTARIWEASTGAQIGTLLHTSEVFAVAVVDPNHVVTGSRDGAQIWDVSLQRRIGPVCTNGNEIMYITGSADGKTVVLADWRGRCMIWSLPRLALTESSNRVAWIECEVGMQLDQGTGRRVLTGEAWLDVGR